MTDAHPGRAGVEAAEPFADHGRPTLLELARVFLFIGAAGFGGGMAIVAMIEDICVAKRRWMSAEEFAHGVAFGQFLGAFAVNTTTFVGFRMLGLPGAVTAVTAFLAPGVALVIVISALYVRYHNVPALQTALHGIGPVVVAVLLSAAYRMGRAALATAQATDHSVGARSWDPDGERSLGARGSVCDGERSLAARGSRLPSAIEPAAVCLVAFAFLFFMRVPVIVILLAVAIYGTVRELLRRRGADREDPCT